MFALAVLGTDRRVLGSTFNDEILIEKFAPRFTALHGIGNGLAEAYHRQDHAESCILKCDGEEIGYIGRTGPVTWLWGL